MKSSIFKAKRAESDINPVALSKVIFDGEDRYYRYLKLCGELDSALKLTPEIYEMSREDITAYVLQNSNKMKMATNANHLDGSIVEEANSSINFHPSGSIGALMSVYGISIMATEEQKAAWLPSIVKNVWMACYAQTELGHGTDVQSLKTIARFDTKTQEFEIHTPSIDAAKWWPGDLGIHSSHCFLMARLYSNGKCYGVQPFFFPFRDYKTHELYKGVEVGDIGPKLGFNTKDNGFMLFDRFRVPKTALLGRFISVDNEGNVEKRGNPKVMYSSLMKTRSYILCSAYAATFKSLTIATRYSLLRKQFKDKDGEEITIYDYQLQKEKLFSQLAKAYAMASSMKVVRRLIKKNEENGKKGDFSLLQQCHILLSGYKACFTTWNTTGIVKMIQACGGHGYSHFSGLPYILLENFSETILEGENSVLLLQVARSLLKTAQLIQAGELDKIPSSFDYLTSGDDVLEFELPEVEEALEDPLALIKTFARISAFHVRDTSLSMFQHITNGIHPKTAWDKHMGSKLGRIGLLHTYYSIVKNFNKTLSEIKEKPILRAYTLLFQLFTFQRLEEIAAPALAAGAVTGTHFLMIQNRKEQIYEALSPHGLVLAEGIPYSENLLNSAIAADNENPYENLYEWAKKYGQLNKHMGKPHPNVVKHWLPFSQKMDQKLTSEERRNRAKL